MKIKHIIGLSFILLFVYTSCSSDYLNVDTSIKYATTDTLVMTDLQYEANLPLTIEEAGNQEWTLVKYPRWLIFKEMSGRFVNGHASFSVKTDTTIRVPFGGYASVPIFMDVKNIGRVQVHFVYGNLSYTPFITCSNTLIDLTKTESTIFTVINYGVGIWNWKIVEKPEWVTLFQNEGSLNVDEELNMRVSSKKGNLPDGMYSGKIKIVNNSVNDTLNIDVKMSIPRL